MQVSNLPWRGTHPSGGYSIDLLMTDNREICRRKDWNQSKFDSCVYIFCQNDNMFYNLGWNINVTGSPLYFGFSKSFNWSNIFNNRPFLHYNDLLSEIINNEIKCYCILGLSELEAHCLEALWIKQSDKKLSKPGEMILRENCLINKRRERKYEDLIDKYLNIENQWK